MSTACQINCVGRIHDQTCACSKSSFGLLNRPVHPCYSIRLYARAALAWTIKKRSLRNEKLKANRSSDTEEQRKERLRIRRENEKIENHGKQRLATLKRLKRGDNNELKRNLRLERVVAGKQLRLAVVTEEERRARLENNAAILKSWHYSNLMF